MKIAHSKTFRSGNSDALRLPKEVSIGADVEVEIVNSGGVLTIRAKRKMTPKELAEALDKLPRPRQIQERDQVVAPRRKGL